MIRSFFAVLGGLLSLTASAALAAQDPTFNGTIARAECGLKTVTGCQDGYCSLITGPCEGQRCGTLYVMVDRGVYRVDGETKPLVFTEVSPAEIGKPLWLKFKVEFGKLTGNAMVLMKPDPLRLYVTTATVFFDAAPKDGDHKLMLINLECDRFPTDHP